VSVTVDYVVQQAKLVLDRRRVEVDSDNNVTAVNDSEGDAAITFTLTPALAESLTNGTLDLAVGFMRGDVKMSGDFGALLHVLPALERTAER
jgi:hypothetical protein